MITEPNWYSKTQDWLEKVLEVMVNQAELGVTHIREQIIYRKITPAGGPYTHVRGGHYDQNKGFYVSGRKFQIKELSKCLRRMVLYGDLIVVRTFPMRDHRLLGVGTEEAVLAVGTVLDRLAGAVHRPVEVEHEEAEV